MKNGVKNVIVALLIILPMTMAVGQQRQERDRSGRGQWDGRGIEMLIPDLTEDQKGKIQELHLNMTKESTQIRNQLGEIRARMRTLQSADNPDMKEIDKLIDESSGLQAQLQKKGAANHQEIRKLLSDDQRVIFDARSGQMRARTFQRQGREGMRGERRERMREHRSGGTGAE